MSQAFQVARNFICPVKKWISSLILVSWFVLPICLGVISKAEGQEREKGYSAILARARTLGPTRIIVGLDVSFMSEGMLSSAQDALDQRRRIGEAQRQLLESPAMRHARGIRKFKYIPYIAMEADASELMALNSDPLVISIHEDVPIPLTLAQSVPLINADDAWALGYSGSGWDIAILDSGVDKTHTFFSGGKVVEEACFSTTSADSTTLCPNGQQSQIGSGAGVNCSSTIFGCDHGTHVAGIAAGNSGTINGVARDAGIISIQICSRFSGADCSSAGLPSPCVFSYTSDQIEGLEHVYSLRTTHNIAAANLSIGGELHSTHCDGDPTKAAIDNLRSVGIATVIASGNDGSCNSISAPACISTAVSVGATTKSDSMASYSNYSQSLLSLFAPGSSIYSSVPGGWAYKSGTSMAAPHVAGAWAILKQRTPFASVLEILNALKSTGTSIPNNCTGVGFYPQRRIDVLAGLNSLIVPTGTVQGTVTEEAFPGKPLASARISFDPPYTAYADEEGFYQLLNFPIGTYDIAASAYRYTPSVALGVSVFEGGTTTQDFALACDVSFGDVPTGYWAEDYIKSMYCREITNGCSSSPLLFCPMKAVSRAVMSVFIIRSLRGLPAQLPYNTYFDDIANDWLAPYINRMFELGITGGCGPRLFCPDNPVLRKQVSVFFIRALGESTSTASYDAYFDDVADDPFAPYINRMFELGITGGCGPRLYCPYNGVNRQQTAVFVGRAF